MDTFIKIIGIHSGEIREALTNKTSTIEPGTYPSLTGELSVYPTKQQVSIKLIKLDCIGQSEEGLEDYIGDYQLTAKGESIIVKGSINPDYKEFTCCIDDIPSNW